MLHRVDLTPMSLEPYRPLIGEEAATRLRELSAR